MRKPYTCRCCGEPISPQIQFRYERRHGRFVAVDSYALLTCRTPGCTLENVTASENTYEQTTAPFLAGQAAHA